MDNQQNSSSTDEPSEEKANPSEYSSQAADIHDSSISSLIQVREGNVLIGDQKVAPPPIDPSILEAEPMPSLEGFVVRNEEINYYKTKLAQEKFTVIEGMPGSGKSLLGSFIAEQTHRPVFWMTFRKDVNDNAEAIIWEIAKFLARQKDDDLWRFLEGERQSQRPQELNLKISFLASSLKKKQFILCFDDFHLVNENDRVISLFEYLRESVKSTSFLLIGLIVMSRHLPRLVGDVTFHSLQGFKKDEARTLLEQNQINLVEELFDKLYQRTEGFPQFLKLFISWTQNLLPDYDTTKEFITNMPRKGNIKKYLLSNVYATLSSQEKKLARALSIPRIPITRIFAEALLQDEIEDVQIFIEDLIRKHVLQEDEDGNFIYFHSLVQEFLAGLLDRSSARILHRKASKLYLDSVNVLESGFHLFEAGNYKDAAKLLIDNSDQLIDSESAVGLLNQLLRFDSTMLNKDNWRSLLTCRGDIHERIGEYTQSIECFNQALLFCDTPHYQAKLHRKLGWSYQRISKFDESKSQFQSGIDILASFPTDSELPRLYYRLAFTHRQIAEYTQSRELAQKALALLDESTQAKDVAAALNILGGSYISLGEHNKALEICERALKININIKNQYGIQTNLGNLGSAYSRLGNFEKAIDCISKSLQIAKICNYVTSQAISYETLGDIHIMQGHLPEAIESAQNALSIYEKVGDIRGTATAHMSLGTIQFQLGNWNTAAFEWEKALNLLEKAGDKKEQSLVNANLGILYFQQGNPNKALQAWKNCLAITREMGDSEAIAGLLGNIAQVYVLQGKLSTAIKSINESSKYALTSNNPYLLIGLDAARGAIFKEKGQFEHAVKLLKDAREKAMASQVIILLPEILGTLAEAYLGLKELPLAFDACNEGLKVAEESKNPLSQALITRVLGQYYTQIQAWSDAEECFSKSLITFEQLGILHEQGETLFHLGKMYGLKGDKEKARDFLGRSFLIFQKLEAKIRVGQVREALDELLGDTHRS